jgi:hypothetical protein
MRTVMMLLALGASPLAVLAAGGAQGGPQEANDCDLATVQHLPYCRHCGEILAEPTDLREGRCATCNGEVAERAVCVKTYYECARCHHTAAQAGNHCEAPMQQKTSRALVVFRCPACRQFYCEEGRCTSEGCRRRGEPLQRTCALSGSWPHARRQPDQGR